MRLHAAPSRRTIAGLQRGKGDGVATEQDIMAATILVVDDQDSNIALLRMLLRDAGFKRVVCTNDSRAAIGLYAEHRPDIVLLDLQMPHLDGFGVMQQIRELDPLHFAPILVLTAEIDTKIRYRALESGARDFLLKPFDRVEVKARIRNLVEMRKLHMQTIAYAADLEGVVAERTLELRATQMEIIHRLGHAAEYKDNETGNHIIRMSLYCRVLAEAIGMSSEEQELLLGAAPMHDVGKIGIPDRILCKPAKLTPDEWEIMKTHAEIGADLLSGSNSPLIQMAQITAWTHHERWDGTGYPRGLVGDQIPLTGRIVAVCDVFDALTSVRPYKPAWPMGQTIAALQAGVGSHFDPKLVAQFLSQIPEILAIRSQYQEE